MLSILFILCFINKQINLFALKLYIPHDINIHDFFSSSSLLSLLLLLLVTLIIQ